MVREREKKKKKRERETYLLDVFLHSKWNMFVLIVEKLFFFSWFFEKYFKSPGVKVAKEFIKFKI